MIPIPINELQNHLGKEILLKENNKESVIVFEKIKSGWLAGRNKTTHSYFEILIGGKEDEHAPKYYLK